MNCKGENEKLNKSEIKEVASEVSVRLFFDWLNNLTSFLLQSFCCIHPLFGTEVLVYRVRRSSRGSLILSELASQIVINLDIRLTRLWPV